MTGVQTCALPISYLAQKGSTTKPPVPGLVPGAKRINHQAAGARTRTWRKNYQPPSRRFQDSYLARKGSTTKPPVPGLAPGAKRINHQAAVVAGVTAIRASPAFEERNNQVTVHEASLQSALDFMPLPLNWPLTLPAIGTGG